MKRYSVWFWRPKMTQRCWQTFKRAFGNGSLPRKWNRTSSRWKTTGVTSVTGCRCWRPAPTWSTSLPRRRNSRLRYTRGSQLDWTSTSGKSFARDESKCSSAIFSGRNEYTPQTGCAGCILRIEWYADSTVYFDRRSRSRSERWGSSGDTSLSSLISKGPCVP